jgi:Flp pilus assembly protein TadG
MRPAIGGSCRADVHGSAALELVLVAPLLIALLLFVAGLGRIASARGQVEGAAREAARAASLERSVPAAAAAGDAAARATLGGRGVTCAELHVNVDVSAYVPGGQVTASVACTADLSRLALAGFPGHRTFRATSVAPIETWRGVSTQ